MPSGGDWQVTQLGHVKDLAVAFKMMLGNEKARGQIYNISGERYSRTPVMEHELVHVHCMFEPSQRQWQDAALVGGVKHSPEISSGPA